MALAITTAAAEAGTRPARLVALAASAAGTQGVLAAISAFVPPLLIGALGAGAGAVAAALAVGPAVGLIVPGVVGALIDRARASVARRRGVLLGGAALAVSGLVVLLHAPSLGAAIVALALIFAGLHAASSAQRASVAQEVATHEHAAVTAAQAAAKGVGALLVLFAGSVWVARAPTAGLWWAGALLAGSAGLTAVSLRGDAVASPAPVVRGPWASAAVRRLLWGHAALWVALHTMFAFTGLFVTHELIGVTELASAEGHAATAQATQVLVVFTLSAVGAAVPLGALARRVGGHRALRVGALALAAGLVLALVARDVVWAWPIAVLCGVGFAAVQVVPYPLLLARVPESRHGALAAAFALSIEGPQLVALAAAGLLVELTHSYRTIYLLSLVALSIGARTLGLHRAPIVEAETSYGAQP